LFPYFPEEGLDNSWKFGMNQIMSMSLHFGQDVIFTFGPYASVYTKLYHPDTHALMMIGSFYFSISYWCALVQLIKNGQIKPSTQRNLVLLFVLFFISMQHSKDAYFFSYSLIVGFLCIFVIKGQEEDKDSELSAVFLTSFLFFPLGLLPLIKGTFLMLCISIVSFSAILFLYNRKWVLTVVVCLSPIASMLFFWVLAGQPFLDLPGYFTGMLPVVAGFTDAMSKSHGRLVEIPWYQLAEIPLYLVTAVVLLITIVVQKEFDKNFKLFLSVIFSVCFFLSFKAGFVRHDGHAYVAAGILVFSAIFLAFIIKSRLVSYVVSAALITWVFIDASHVGTSTFDILTKAKKTYVSAWAGYQNRVNLTSWLNDAYENSLSELNEFSHFPVLEGTSDIYSFNQSLLIASGNNWNPRPVMQSYSAYKPELAEKNKEHLLGDSAPDNIFFKVETIDKRAPALDDGASWPLLINNYRPVSVTKSGYLLLKNKHLSRSPNYIKIGDGDYLLGDIVHLPESSGVVFAKLKLEKSFLGHMASFFFKPNLLKIYFKLSNGEVKIYRFIPEMAKSGFILSPLVEDTNDFESLFGSFDSGDGKQVKFFSIVSVDDWGLWGEKYNVVFEQIESVPAD
jgi:hypothetical protein